LALKGLKSYTNQVYNCFLLYFVEDKNVIVSFCKIHNDSSVDVSQDGSLVGVFVPSEYGFPVDAQLKVISLRKESFGECIYSRKYGLYLCILLVYICIFMTWEIGYIAIQYIFLSEKTLYRVFLISSENIYMRRDCV